MLGNSPGDRYVSPKFQVLTTDSCHTELNSPQNLPSPKVFHGTRANVAFFTWSYCKGSPVFYDGTDKKILDTLFCMSTSTGYNCMAFSCEGTGPWQYVSPRPQKDYLPSPSPEAMLLIGRLFAALMLVRWVWWSSGSRRRSRRVLWFCCYSITLLIHVTGFFRRNHGPIALTVGVR